jgi:hypothetical protein
MVSDFRVSRDYCASVRVGFFVVTLRTKSSAFVSFIAALAWINLRRALGGLPADGLALAMRNLGSAASHLWPTPNSAWLSQTAGALASSISQSDLLE